MRIAISAGHGKGDPGAVNETLGLQEHAEAVKICREFERQLQEVGIDVLVIPYGVFSLKEKIAEVNAAHAESQIAQAIEVHFNSNPGPPAYGTEVLFQSVKNRDIAKEISRELATAIGTTDRGAKQRMNLGWLKQTKPPALIVEVLFINNNDEASKVKGLDFAERAAAGITRGLTGTTV